MSGNTERNLVPAIQNDAGNTVYTKLRDLTDAEAAKGIYVSLAAGGSVAGVLEGSEEDNYGKTAYSIKLGNGKTQVVTGAGNLGRQLASVAKGTYVQITYNGKQEMKSGQWKGKESHNFTVLKEQI